MEAKALKRKKKERELKRHLDIFFKKNKCVKNTILCVFMYRYDGHTLTLDPCMTSAPCSLLVKQGAKDPAGALSSKKITFHMYDIP